MFHGFNYGDQYVVTYLGHTSIHGNETGVLAATESFGMARYASGSTLHALGPCGKVMLEKTSMSCSPLLEVRDYLTDLNVLRGQLHPGITLQHAR
jgi:hypothetical protein